MLVKCRAGMQVGVRRHFCSIAGEYVFNEKLIRGEGARRKYRIFSVLKCTVLRFVPLVVEMPRTHNSAVVHIQFICLGIFYSSFRVV